MDRLGSNFMKNILTILFLALTLPVFGANPSFNAFDANFFQVTGTGNNSIKIKTNAFTWLNAGSSVWTNDVGVIHPVSTNQIYFYPNGAIVVDANTLNWDTPTASTVFMSYRDGSTGNASIWNMGITDAGLNNDWTIGMTVALDSVLFRLIAASSAVTTLNPTAADGVTPYTLDTSLAHTEGKLLTVPNDGVEKFAIGWDGTPTLDKTNAPPTGFAVGVTVPVTWFVVTNAGLKYLVPGYAP